MLHNAETQVKGTMLTVVIDLSKDLGPSSTGKTNLIAKGKDEIGNGVFISLNAFRYPEKRTKIKKRNS